MQRTAQAVQMRLRGKSYSEIGAVLGITKQAAHQLVTAAFEEMRTQTAEDTEQLRQIELARLEELHDRFMPLTQAAEDPVLIDAAKKAADIVLKAAERRAKLLGLDAPTKSEVSGKDGQPLIAGVFAIPLQQSSSVDEWARLAQQSVQPSQALPDKTTE